MATIRNRGPKGKGPYEAQVRIRGFKPLTRTFKVKADAIQWAAEREAELRRGVYVDTRSLRDVTLRGLLERYLTEVSPTHKGCDVEQIRLKAMMREPMADLTLDLVNSAVIQEWRAKRELNCFH